MSFNGCRFCDHRNPAAAKFCSACGGALHLAPCPHCGAVSDVAATVCYQCRGQLPGHKTDALEPAPAAVNVTTGATPASPASNNAISLFRLPALLILGVAGVVALIGVTGYYDQQHRAVEETRPLSAGSEASERGTPAITEPKEGAVIATPQDVSAQAAAEYREGSEAKPAPPERACTDAAAALDLCETQPVQRREAETSVQAEKSSSRITGAEAGTQDPPRVECTEAVTALGLCTTEPTQRKN